MEDSMDSMPTEESALELYEQLSALWLKAGMCARKWLSNSRIVLENIPQKERAKEVNLDTSYLPTTKALGVTWQAEEDVFTFKLNKNVSSVPTVRKRNLLKRVASLFDPLGFLSPYIVKGKILLQQFWLGRYDWDDRVSSNLTDKTMEWLDDLPVLNKVIIPRSLSFNDSKNPSLNVFVEEAYGTAVFMRSKNQDDDISVKFVCSKTRVSPLTAVNIPRLELMAAVLGLRLALTVTKAIVMSMIKVTFWTDSANVIHWISNESRRFKPFVAHRIGEIHTYSAPKQWRYVSTTDNPADIASRRTTAEDLVQNTLWWNGDVTTEDLLDPERFSDWSRLLRVTAWVKRFADNFRNTNDRNKNSVLTVKELQEAENLLIHKAQVKQYPEEYSSIVKGQPIPRNSKLIPLNVKIDEQGMMRCDTRLTHARFLPYDVRYPIILPRKSPVTRLLVKSFHEEGNHYGTNQTLAAMSSRYWFNFVLM
ncbi:uncharacterized protein LOC128555058 [Mercenaria mercenaria]|uniref:uncharacterized protein LOC128555058 n=1 Tax=Mercenaria mercenaria TaxID=6596 RepID=UPI00234E483F|nr:uncharacterized protein LOC128555058 [Mercenaria mercenaria]